MCDSYVLLLRVLLLWRVRGTCGGPAGAAAMLQPALSLSQKSLQSLPIVAQHQRKRPAISRTAIIQVCTCLRFHVLEKLFPGWLQWLIYAHGPGPCLSCLLLCLAPLHGDSGRQTAYSIACITAICLQGSHICMTAPTQALLQREQLGKKVVVYTMSCCSRASPVLP